MRNILGILTKIYDIMSSAVSPCIFRGAGGKVFNLRPGDGGG